MSSKRIALLALTLLATVGFACLGVWQVERRSWKLDLIARVEARVNGAPAPLPLPAQWPYVNERDDAYRKVRVDGMFLYGCETLVQALTEDGAGFWVMTPLRTDAGTVLVNRGFVPAERRDPRTRQAGQVPGPVTITGLLRMTELKGGFLRSNDPAANRWYSRDVDAIARACGLAQAAPFFIDADAAPNPGRYPIGGLTVVAFRNSHLVYALTWFGLTALSTFGTMVLFRAGPGR